MCGWPSTDCWPFIDCCVSSSIFSCIQVGTEGFYIERVAYIQSHMKKLVSHGLSSSFWLWIGHSGARQLEFGQGECPYWRKLVEGHVYMSYMCRYWICTCSGKINHFFMVKLPINCFTAIFYKKYKSTAGLQLYLNGDS